MALAALMLASTSCGDDRDLLSITVIPDKVTLNSVSLTAQFIANGTFNRGPDEDITNSVTWASAQPQIVSISSSGLATRGTVCGTATITASREGVTGTATVTQTFCGP
ncbi:MAG: hypothetical protein ACRD3R_05915 [Terriglobales bacterium]